MAGRSQTSLGAAPFPAESAAPRKTRKRNLILVTLLAAVALGVNVPGWLAQYQDSRLRALSLDQLETLTANQPGNLDARYRLGLAYARVDKLPEAIREFMAVVEKDPVRADVLNDLAVAYLIQQRYHECLVALRGALTAKPDFAPARANLGRLYIATQMPFSAVRELEHAAKLEPNNASTRCDLGEAYQRTLNQEASERAFREALTVDPSHTAARVGLGKVLYARTKYDEAERVLMQALKESPENPEALIALGRMRFERSSANASMSETRALFERAAKADPSNPDASYDLGRIAMREKRPKDAVPLFRLALRQSPGHSGAMNQLERALRASGEVKEADRVAETFYKLAMRGREKNRLQDVISRSPNDWDARAKLVEIYVKSGEAGLARLVYRQLKEGEPKHPRLPELARMITPESAP